MRDPRQRSVDELTAARRLMGARSLEELSLAARDANPALLATGLTRVIDDLQLPVAMLVRLRAWNERFDVETVGDFLAATELHAQLRREMQRPELQRFVELMGVWLAARWMTKHMPEPAAGQIPHDVQRWAEENGVLDSSHMAFDALPTEVFEAAPWMQRSHQTVAVGLRQGYRPEHEKLRERLWAWLQGEARAVAEARARGPVRPPRPDDAVLGELWDRLSAARTPLDRLFPTRPRAAQIGLMLRDDPPRLECTLKQRQARPQHMPEFPRVGLTLPRAGPVSLSCSCGRDPCAHRAQCLDAVLHVLTDGKSPLVITLRNELTQAVWQKALSFQVELPPVSRRAASVIGFVVSIHQGDVRIEVRAHRVGKKGPSQVGRPVRALKALAFAGLSASERLVLQHLTLYEEGRRYTEEDAEALAEALLALEGHPRVCCDDDTPELPVSVKVGRAGVRFDETAAGLHARFTLGGTEFEFAQTMLLPCRGARLLVQLVDRTLWLAHVDDAALGLMSGVARYQAVFPPEAHDALLARLEQVPSLEAALPPSLEGTELPSEPKPVVRVEHAEGEGLELRLLVRALEGCEPWAPDAGPERPAVRRDGQRFFTRRDRTAERALLDGLGKQLELAPSPDHQWRVAEALDAIALVDRLEDLARAGLDVEWPAKRWRLTRAAKTSDVKVQVTRKRDWFGLDGEVHVDGERVQLAVLLDAVRRRRRWVKLKDQQWLRLSRDLVERLQGLSHLAAEGDDGLEVTWAALPALESLEGELEQLELVKDFAQMMQRVREAGRTDAPVPRALKAELRDYQLQGFRWLSRLAAWGAGACLADDMGLGKTVQALALLLSRAKEGPALVVAPTSVVFNWREEAARFAPSLKVHEYRTADRGELLGKLGPGDVVLASWALLQRDAEKFAAVELATLVLDEAQAIKNASTQRAKAARGLKAGFKLALSGTPLENHLGELWSLYRVVLPGLFGSLEQFRARFALPIERDSDPAARAALAAVVRPFLLRRNKSEVAKELPARTELALHVELSEAERKLYDDARLAAIAELKTGEPGQEKRRFQALAALTRLRQIACHPRLYDEQWTGPASKLARLLELLLDLRDAGHRALVFSQFTSHLALVRDAITAAGFSHQYLDGSTPAAQRQQRVEAFQAGEGELFLISLKAGGMGLNLTAADYVVHLDPWWNPAVEDQATDRAHRIGQVKPVTVYRLIAVGTVEEGIVALHEEKRNLVAGVLDGTAAAGTMSMDELVGLIRGG